MGDADLLGGLEGRWDGASVIGLHWKELSLTTMQVSSWAHGDVAS